jgi:hypothetical protein
LAEEKEEYYSIPAKYRKMENLHILFWLIKDLCWCLVFKPLGIAMIFPTLLISVFIMWRTRQVVSEFVHNMAITLWIFANSMWMVSEFFSIDKEVKPWCLIPFSLGLVVLGYYYLWYAPKHKLQMKKGEQMIGEQQVALNNQ